MSGAAPAWSPYRWPASFGAALARRGRTECSLVALLAVAVIVLEGPRPMTAGLLWLAAVTPRLIAIDIAEHRLPDAIVLPGYPVAALAAGTESALGGADWATVVVAPVAYGGLVLLAHVTGGMGFGDVKLAPVLGLLLGALSPAAAVAGPMLALFAGGLMAAVALVGHGRRARIPFGPPMLLGAWAALLLSA